jgi:hypothetical protein
MVDMIRSSLLLPLLAVVALALAACGSSKHDNNSGGTSDDDKAYDGALKFASCMRQHGVNVPDPQRASDGGILMKVDKDKGAKGAQKSTTLGPDNPKFKAAEKQCDKYNYHGGGHAPSPAEQAKQQDALIAYARCMRSKGIPFADPKFEGNKVQMRMNGSIRPDSAKFKAADEVCHPLMAKAGDKDGPGLPAGSAAAPAQ